MTCFGRTGVVKMTENTSTVKITLEINQETNMDDLMAHLYMMKDRMPNPVQEDLDLLEDFSIHEGELEPVSQELPWAQ